MIERWSSEHMLCINCSDCSASTMSSFSAKIGSCTCSVMALPCHRAGSVSTEKEYFYGCHFISGRSALDEPRYWHWIQPALPSGTQQVTARAESDNIGPDYLRSLWNTDQWPTAPRGHNGQRSLQVLSVSAVQHCGDGATTASLGEN